MSESKLTSALATHSDWRCYLEVCKPKVVATMLFTALAGMLLATPGEISFTQIITGLAGIALVAGSAAAINQMADHRIDAVMRRTQRRPLPSGQLTEKQVLIFAFVIGSTGTLILLLWTNTLTATLTLLSLVGYAFIYTRYLKYATPQNIVIGGAAGAMPPLLGWISITGHVDSGAIILFLIIFAWTPPHFWALALYRLDDYRDAEVPMLPVTHGESLTRTHILLYTVLLALITLLPYATRMTGDIYLFGALLLNAVFIYHSAILKLTGSLRWAKNTFSYSIVYLLLLFTALLLDTHLPFFYPLFIQ